MITGILDIKMNTAKLNVYKKVLQEVYKNSVGTEGFISILSAEDVNLFCL